MAEEEIVQVVNDRVNGENGSEDPEEGVGKGIENEGRGAETEGEAGVKEEGTQPVKTQQWPLTGVDRTETECVLDVDLGHKGRWAGSKHHGDSVIEGTIGDGELIDGNPLVDRASVVVG